MPIMMTAMRKPIQTIGVVSCLLLASVAWAAPPVHQASGGGTIEFNGSLETIAFVAQIDAAGDVKGQAEFQLRDLSLTFHVVVDCLQVSGVDAWISGLISTSNDPALVGQRVLWQVRDNGEGDAFSPDQVSLPVQFNPTAPCQGQPTLPLVPWTNGNVQVR
jgi:hypothetical protein